MRQPRQDSGLSTYGAMMLVAAVDGENGARGECGLETLQGCALELQSRSDGDDGCASSEEASAMWLLLCWREPSAVAESVNVRTRNAAVGDDSVERTQACTHR